MKRLFTVISVLVFFGVANGQAQIPAKEVSCRACHGVSGAAPITGSYPKINGQNKAYLVSSLKAYRAGERKGGLAAAMSAQASQLSDVDIEALASYYAAQK